MHLHHCIYASVATDLPVRDELLAILRQSRAANTAADITGMLLHVNGNYFQVLEGEADAVHRLLARIETDPRHHSIVRIIDEPIHRRQFGAWSMGFASLSWADLRSVIGTNDFFGDGSCLTSLNEGRAKKLLTVFARGRWQRTTLARAS